MPKPLTIKKLKVHTALSEETTCFSASLYLGTTEVGTISNRGQGGEEDIFIDPPHRAAVAQAAEQYRDAAVSMYTSWGLGDTRVETHDILEHLAVAAIEDYENRKMLRKLKTDRAITFEVSPGRVTFVAVRTAEDPSVVAARHVPADTSWTLIGTTRSTTLTT